MSLLSIVASVILAFVFFFAAIALELLLLLALSAIFGGTVGPRGLGWVFIPMSAAAAGARLGARLGHN
jgi:hypothetical protein